MRSRHTKAIERAETERAEAINQVIYWRNACSDVRDVAEARGVALRAVLTHPGAFDVAMLNVKGRTPDVTEMARHELQMYRPGGWIDSGKEQCE